MMMVMVAGTEMAVKMAMKAIRTCALLKNDPLLDAARCCPSAAGNKWSRCVP